MHSIPSLSAASFLILQEPASDQFHLRFQVTPIQGLGVDAHDLL